MIGLGVGAAVTVFSVIKPFMVAPLPFEDPGRLVWIAGSEGASLSAYGAVALLLATLGIYGVLAQSVAERTDEIGIRVALGASGGSLIRGVMGRILLLVTTLAGWIPARKAAHIRGTRALQAQ